MFQTHLQEMIELLEKGAHHHWAQWFRLAQKLYLDGQLDKSYSKVLRAYGGMGSFNDVYWNLNENDFDRLEYLRGQVWTYSKANLN
ncbi:hypothetical protein [Shewanella sp. NIFS-20-20]|uniref:DUF6966 domain-containing protein n=1 Tax=Shewanella sp. NIFS-20-20 TaxID=2853806 RepID=UPI001C46CDF1|nr:hypothetical protein [Shewanella sp. NIFS-20-20]MBV7314297.1 hypothetical protein [Shewanella sp. NIFS-20-20]